MPLCSYAGQSPITTLYFARQCYCFLRPQRLKVKSRQRRQRPKTRLSTKSLLRPPKERLPWRRSEDQGTARPFEATGYSAGCMLDLHSF
ncbi:hypothetical protein BDV19DRAFT_175441 [Aspergillus venezuelensis]